MVVIASMYEAIVAQSVSRFDGSRAQALIPKRFRPHRPAGWAMPSGATWVSRVPEFGGEGGEQPDASHMDGGGMQQAPTVDAGGLSSERAGRSWGGKTGAGYKGIARRGGWLAGGLGG